MTDLHVDMFYTVGLEADCGTPQCCRPQDMNVVWCLIWKIVEKEGERATITKVAEKYLFDKEVEMGRRSPRSWGVSI